MSSARKACSGLSRTLVLWAVIATANLVALYIAAGVAFNGDWNRVDNAIVKAYDGIFKD
jgi:hypothetical protein